MDKFWTVHCCEYFCPDWLLWLRSQRECHRLKINWTAKSPEHLDAITLAQLRDAFLLMF